MQFLWKQLIIVSSDGIIFCIIPQLTFFHSLVYPMLVHNSTTVFLIFCILLHNRINEVPVDRHLSHFLSSCFVILFCFPMMTSSAEGNILICAFPEAGMGASLRDILRKTTAEFQYLNVFHFNRYC